MKQTLRLISFSLLTVLSLVRCGDDTFRQELQVPQADVAADNVSEIKTVLSSIDICIRDSHMDCSDTSDSTTSKQNNAVCKIELFAPIVSKTEIVRTDGNNTYYKNKCLAANALSEKLCKDYKFDSVKTLVAQYSCAGNY